MIFAAVYGAIVGVILYTGGRSDEKAAARRRRIFQVADCARCELGIKDDEVQVPAVLEDGAVRTAHARCERIYQRGRQEAHAS